MQMSKACQRLFLRNNRDLSDLQSPKQSPTVVRYCICQQQLYDLIAYLALAQTDSARLIQDVVLSDGPQQQAPSSLRNPTSALSQALIRRKEQREIKPDYHAPWKLMRVISGHLGWVRSVAVEPGNKWFASGAGDRVVKIWDLASGELKLSLTGHISTVRGLAVSPRHPYLFSCGEDKVRASPHPEV